MKHLVIQRRTVWTRLVEACLASAPPWLSAVLTGPVTRFTVGATPPRRLSRLRPVDIVLPRDAVLKRRLRIPRQGLPDLPHAIDLLVERETPFISDDLLIHAQEDHRSEPGQFLSFVIRMTPLGLVRLALAGSRISPRSIHRIAFEEADRLSSTINAATALHRWPRIGVLLHWLPAIAFLAGAALLSQSLLYDRQRQVTLLQQHLTAQITQLETLQRNVDDAATRNSGRDAIASIVSSTLSPYDAMGWLRARLPPTMEVSRIEVRAGTVRLSARSPDMLTDLEALTVTDASWSASLDGVLTADPSTGLEMATIVARHDGAGR